MVNLIKCALQPFDSGNVAVKLGKTDEIQAAVILHPGRLTDEEIDRKFCVPAV